MTQETIIETIGTIWKKETICSLEEGLSNNVLVLETRLPFPGYHGETIPDKKMLNPRSVFLITKTRIEEEDILRYTRVVKRKGPELSFDAAPAAITLYNEKAYAIRVKKMEDYHKLGAIIKGYQQEGIEFQRYRKLANYEGLIKVLKYFVVKQLDKGIYLDQEDQFMAYIQVPRNLSWEKFEEITLSIKRNLEDDNFDAALGSFYRKTGLIEIIRIYDNTLDLETLSLVRDKYLKEVERL